MQRYVVALQCIHCGSERAHTVTYLGNIISDIACSRCEATLSPRPDDLLERYVRDLELRLAGKPGKMLRHARQRPVEFLLHYLPMGLVRKPVEILREWKVLARATSARSMRHSRCTSAPLSRPGRARRE